MVTRVDDKEDNKVVSLENVRVFKHRLTPHSSTASLFQQDIIASDSDSVLPLRRAQSAERSRSWSGGHSTGLSFHLCLTKERKRDAVRSLIECNKLLVNGALLSDEKLQRGELASARIDKTIKEIQNLLPQDILNTALNATSSSLTQFCQEQVQNNPMRIGLSPELLQQVLLVYRAAVKLSKAAEETQLENAISCCTPTKS